MKLNILILLLLVVIANCGPAHRLHNVVTQVADSEEQDNAGLDEGETDDDVHRPSQIIMEKSGEPWTKSKQIESPTSVNMTSDNKCGRREGWVGLISNLNDFTYNDQYQIHALHARQVFVELTQNAITFFANHNVNSVLQTILLKDIDTPEIPEQLNTFNCLQLKLGNKQINAMTQNDDNVVEPINIKDADQNAIVSFCLNSQSDMKMWANDIISYFNCAIVVNGIVQQNPGNDPGHHEDDQDNWSLTGSGSQTITITTEKMRLEKQRLAIIAQKKKLQTQLTKKSEYERRLETEQEYTKEMHKITTEENSEEQIITEKSQQIVDELNVGIQSQMEERRRLNYETTQLEDERTKIQEERDCLDALLQQRSEKERELSESMIRSEQQTKEEQQLSAVGDKIAQDQQQEQQRITQATQQINNQLKSDIEQQTSQMTDAALATSKNFGGEHCINNGSNVQIWIQNTCQNLASEGLNKISQITDTNECVQSTKFCNICCSTFIGSDFQDSLNDCKFKCADGIAVKQRFLQIK